LGSLLQLPGFSPDSYDAPDDIAGVQDSLLKEKKL
jgi:hypothetical protein